MERKFDLSDIQIMPAIQSSVESRTAVDHTYSGMHLPLIAAPMDSVCNLNNHDSFLKHGINVCLPRGLKVEHYERKSGALMFYSFSLDEFEELFLRNNRPDIDFVCIDMANGHMKRLHDAVNKAMVKYQGKLRIMVGNIANPKTYQLFAKMGIWGVRCSIGTGNMCTTSVNTAIGYPLGSLIHECRIIKKEHAYKTHIIADGGMKNHSDIIKALALGADYVMVGTMFAYAKESCAKTYIDVFGKKVEISENMAQKMYQYGINVYKRSRGMSTVEVQKDWNKKALRASEGIAKYGKVEYSLETWIDGLVSYLRSAMSYTDSHNLNEFIGDVEFNLISERGYSRFMEGKK